jgi:hypothetical protein
MDILLNLTHYSSIIAKLGKLRNPWEEGISHFPFLDPMMSALVGKRLLCLRNGSGLRRAQTFGLNIPTPLLRHILAALQMLRICLFGRPKRRKQLERYVQYGLKWLEILQNVY